ncbi:MAG: nitrous oxide reductase family maturation protein NosD [Bacteroidota bacterium]|jgi:nitrous oxidase accessory protein
MNSAFECIERMTSARRWHAKQLLLILTVIGGSFLLPAMVQARTIDVRPRSAVSTIRQAVAMAAADDRIVVHAGIYVEGGIIVDKRLSIRGTGDVRISGGGKTGIFLVRADSVWISHMTLASTGISYVEDRAAIKCTGVRFCRFEDLTFVDTFFGLYFAKSARSVVRRCKFFGNARQEAASGNGIHSWYGDSLLIEDNYIERHRDGIYLEFTRNSLVRGNTSRRNLRYGLHFMFSDDDAYMRNTFVENGSGVAVMYTKRVHMRENIFLDNWGSASYGLLLKDITDSRIEHNVFVSNTIGIYAEGGARLTVTCNEFRGNGWAVRLMANCTGNTFAKNSFTANSFDVATNGTRSESWFDGNYWDAYRGYDIDRDGVGDVPFRPVRIFSYIVEKNPPAIILLNSFFIALLDVTERIFPTVTPEALSDAHPRMHASRCALHPSDINRNSGRKGNRP